MSALPGRVFGPLDAAGIRCCKAVCITFADLGPVANAANSPGHGHHERDNGNNHERCHDESEKARRHLIGAKAWPQPIIARAGRGSCAQKNDPLG